MQKPMFLVDLIFFFLFGGCAMCNVHCALDIDNLGNRGIYIELH